MKIKVKNIVPDEYADSDECTVFFSISDKNYSAFGFNFDFKVGEVVDIDFSYIEGDVPWEDRFSKNKDKRKCLIHKWNWAYDGFGQIVSINPVIADFGEIRLDIGNITNDSRVIGEYIYERIEQLNIFPK